MNGKEFQILLKTQICKEYKMIKLIINLLRVLLGLVLFALHIYDYFINNVDMPVAIATIIILLLLKPDLD